MNDEQTNVGPSAATPTGRRPGSARGTAFKLAALVLATLCLVIGAACWFGAPHDGDKKTSTSAAGSDLPAGSEVYGLFHGWAKPDFVVLLSGQMHGYIQPCGCSDPQYGGLERRYNFVKAMEAVGWPVVAFDLGDVPQKQGPAKLANVQGLLKYRYSMEALKRIGYTAVGFGEYEAAQPLNFAVDEYALNDSKPAVLGANLLKKDSLFPDPAKTGKNWGGSYVASWEVATTPGGTKVGALGIVGTHDPAEVARLVAQGKVPAFANIPPSVGDQITAADRKFKFGRADQAIRDGVKALAGADFRVLLYQGPVELAKLIPLADPQFNVILCLDAEEPPGLPVVVGNTFIVRVGHKGKNVGVVGVYARPGKPFEMRYQLVPVGPVYKTPREKEKDHPILALWERYTKDVKEGGYLGNYGKMPHSTQVAVKGMPGLAGAKAGYVGSEACKKCHEHAYEVWQKSDHSHAYQTLVNARNPSLREYDAECIVCHTVGFRYDGGFASAEATPKLKNVSCESCHGPCEVHKNNPNNAALYPLINPWKAPAKETAAQKKTRLLNLETTCRSCHDDDNDVTWKGEKVLERKWGKIIHTTPPPGE
jgi:hypothetical protein